MHETVSEAAFDGVYPDVHQHPLRRHHLADTQRVVEAVAPGSCAERLSDPHRHEVAENGQRRGIDAGDHVGEPSPQQGLAVAVDAVEFVERPTFHESLIESFVDRAGPVGVVWAWPALLR